MKMKMKMRLVFILLCFLYVGVKCQFVDSSSGFSYGLFTSSIADEAYVTYLYFESLLGAIQNNSILPLYAIQIQDCVKFRLCISNNKSMTGQFYQPLIRYIDENLWVMNYNYPSANFTKLTDDIKSWLIKFNQIVLLPCQKELKNIPTQFSLIMEKVNEGKLPSLLSYLKDHPNIKVLLERLRELIIDKNIDQLSSTIGYFIVPYLIELNYLIESNGSLPPNYISLLKIPIMPITNKILKSLSELFDFSTSTKYQITTDQKDMYLFAYDFLNYFLNYFPDVLLNVGIVNKTSNDYKNMKNEKEYFNKLMQPIYNKIIKKDLTITIPNEIYDISYKIINAFMSYFYPPPLCKSVNTNNLASTIYSLLCDLSASLKNNFPSTTYSTFFKAWKDQLSSSTIASKITQYQILTIKCDSFQRYIEALLGSLIDNDGKNYGRRLLNLYTLFLKGQASRILLEVDERGNSKNDKLSNEESLSSSYSPDP